MNRSAVSWLGKAVIYQIYPQSFQDSNDDGIGDLNGIRQRLGYLENLGVNVIWLNPIFDSPFEDAGYDVRDYYKVAPRYGTEADLVALFREAESHGIRVILDLVAGHTSIQHPLFRKSATIAESPEAEQFIWMNRDFDPRTGPTEENYVHNFFPFQPALNFGYAHPSESWQDAVEARGPQRNRAMLRDILAYWMDRGAAGFRVDMASSLVKADPGHTETMRLWQEIRSWWDIYYPDHILVAEWSDPSESISAGFHLDFLMHFNLDVYRSLFFNETGTIPYPDGDCYFDAKGTGSPHPFMHTYKAQLDTVRGRGFISLPTANHDFQRLRCGSRGWEGLRVALVFLLTQAGPPTIYMGDEIGMRFVPETPPTEGSTLDGVAAPNAGTICGERAGTRTPMQWDSSPNAGFSTAPVDQLYLPLDPDPPRPTVATQETDSGSLLNFVRELLGIRRSHTALGAEASYRCLNISTDNYPLFVLRKSAQEACLIVLNPSGNEVIAPLPDGVALVTKLLNGGIFHEAGRLITKPFSFGIWIVESI